MRGNRGAPTAGAPLSAPCCTASSSSRFPPEQMQRRWQQQEHGPAPRTGNGDPAAARRIRLARVAITPQEKRRRTNRQSSPPLLMPLVWSAACCFVPRRRAGITQERGEHRDCCRVLNAPGSMLGPGASRLSAPACRIAARSWSLRGCRALPPCVLVPSVRPAVGVPALRADARAGPGAGRPPGWSFTVTAPRASARASVPADPDRAAGTGRTAAGAGQAWCA